MSLWWPCSLTTAIAPSAADGAMHDAVPAIAALGVSPLVRVPDVQSWMVKRKPERAAAFCGCADGLGQVPWTPEPTGCVSRPLMNRACHAEPRRAKAE